MTAGVLTETVAIPPRAGIVRRMPVYDDDGALMLRYAQGDLSAFTRLYERHKGALFRYLLRQTREHAATEDLFQEVWGRVIASRERYEPRAKFSTFLFSIAHNCFIDHCRRAGTSPTARAEALDEETHAALTEASHRGPERQAESAQLVARLRAALDRLPAEQREVFVLHEETGMSLEEIGELTGVGMETAKSRLRYALAKLRQSLDDVRDASAADVRRVEARTVK
ncbi:MAG TPA: RNA polymerase sigma factor [Steroidobacteraceae bacterium]|nr:RNA polymerase sigma factor [Steroidobacteraceae bacterium]